jgi:hypothetical protein
VVEVEESTGRIHKMNRLNFLKVYYESRKPELKTRPKEIC